MNQDKAEILVERLVRRIEQVNGKFIERMGRRIGEVGALSVTDAHRFLRMRAYGADIDALMRELANVTGKNIAEIREMFEELAKTDYRAAEVLYHSRGKPYLPYEENETLRRFVDTVAETTVATYRNMARSTAFRLPDGRGGARLAKLADAYDEVMDKAVTAVTMGHTDYFSEMRDTMDVLAESGIRTVYTETRAGMVADYASGYSRRLDTAVRQSLLWGVKQCAVGVQERIAADIDADGWEIDYHRFPRPTHAPMGGEMFAIGGAREVDGKRYESFEEKAQPFLEEYGCLHFGMPVILGVSVPRYDAEELARWKAEDAKEITIRGKAYTGYEATQAQRRMETTIRHRKDAMHMAEASGDVEGARRWQTKLSQSARGYFAFSRAAGLSTKYQRMYAAGYKPAGGEKGLNQAGARGIMKEAKAYGRMPYALNASTTQNKIQGYLLNSNHPRGKSKAEVIRKVLGYHYENWDILSDKIYHAVQTGEVIKMTETAYGTKYEIPVSITGETGRSLVLHTVWQLDDQSQIPRLITAKFGKKQKEDKP